MVEVEATGVGTADGTTADGCVKYPEMKLQTSSATTVTLWRAVVRAAAFWAAVAVLLVSVFTAEIVGATLATRSTGSVDVTEGTPRDAWAV